MSDPSELRSDRTTDLNFPQRLSGPLGVELRHYDPLQQARFTQGNFVITCSGKRPSLSTGLGRESPHTQREGPRLAGALMDLIRLRDC